jgi:RNA polymerase sigma-70 factor, ECF subfamily
MSGHPVTHVQSLFISHQTALKSFILSLHPDFTLVDDILQETFLTITSKADDFKPGTSFLAWSRKIAFYKIKEARRRKESRWTSLDEDILDSLLASVPEGGEENQLQKIEALNKCLGKLSPKALELVRLRYFAEHHPGEIATQIGWTRQAVNAALTKSRLALRNCVGKLLTPTALAD